MKIHGTAKGGALSTKDFGVAFGGGNGGSPELEVGSSGGLDTLGQNFVMLIKYPNATDEPIPVIGNTYNSIAMSSLNEPGGNYKLAAYDDDSGEPDALYQATGDHTPDIGYTYRTMTDFDLASTVVWLASTHDTGVWNVELGTAGVTWDRRYKISVAYASAFPDPAGVGWSSATVRVRMKLAQL